jgi:uncharacterized protein
MPTFILKVTNFCNLDCTYCYMFNLGDTTYSHRVKQMNPDTIDAVFARIEEYLSSAPADTPQANICLHGGEPTLWKRSNFDRFFSRLAKHRAIFPRTNVSLQSNFLLYDRHVLHGLRENGIALGISLDGPAQHNDAFRISRDGRGSYDRIIANVRRAQEDGFEDILSGFLCVMNPSIPPDEFLDWVRSLPLPTVKLLWPLEYNHMRTPWQARRMSERQYASAPVYGSWLRTLFDLWWRADDPELAIYTFREMLAVALGFNIHGDQIVNDCVDMLVVDTGGEYTLHDYWRSVSDRFVETGSSVWDASVGDFIQRHPLMLDLLDLKGQLPDECASCCVRRICGGGLISGRARDGRVQLNRKSVMCYDQFEIYSHLAALVSSEVRAA